MSEDLLTAQFKGEPYEKQFKPKMFSGYFRNIKELRSFLYFSRYFPVNVVTISLALAYKIWITTRN
jgi:hypothetical protein